MADPDVATAASATPAPGADAPARSRSARSAIGSTLAILMVLLLAALAWVGTPAPGISAAPATRTVAETRSSRLAPPPAAEPSADAGADSAAPPPAEWTQLCGGDWVRTQADGSIDDETVQALESVQAGYARIRQRLAASPDELGRAALVLHDALSSDSGPGLSDEPRACDLQCQQQRFLAWQRQRAERLDGLARQALGTRDPSVYGLAFRTCPREPEAASACNLLSAQEWARLDPGNGVPWLYAAGEAAASGDAAARDEALFRFATADREDSHWLVATARLIGEAGHDDASQLPTLYMAVRLAGLEAAGAAPVFQSVMGACRGVTLESDPNRWQLCSQVAERLAESSDSALARSVGIRMGQRLGWPVERTDRLRGEMVDLSRAQSAQNGALDGPGIGRDCTATRRALERLADMGRHGEISALRALPDVRARSPEEYERIGREERERRAALEQAEAASEAARRLAAASEPSTAAR